MDPLSAASGVIAVISLAIQVSESDAPTEILRLVKLVDNLYTLRISSSLTACGSIVNQIEGIMGKIKRHYQKGITASRSLVPFWLLCTKHRIDELEKQLDREVSLLTLALVVHVAASFTLMPIKYYPDQQNYTHGPQAIGLSPNALGRSSPLIALNHQTLFKGRSTIFQYSSILGSITLSKRVKVLRRHKSTSAGIIEAQQQSETHIFSIQPSFLSWWLEIYIGHMSPRGPGVGLRPIHVIDEQTEYRLRRIFFDRDLVSLQRILRDGRVTINSVDRFGQSLLMFAQLYSDENAVVYLVGEGCPVDIINIQACTTWASSQEETFQLLCSMSDLADFPVNAVFPEGNNAMTMSAWYEWFTSLSLTHTSLVLSEWLGSKLYVEARAWAMIINEIANSNLVGSELEDRRKEQTHWERLMMQSIRHGANRQYIDEDQLSAVGQWIQSYHPIDAQQIVESWLEILQSCGVDITDDLQEEIALFKAAQNSAERTWKSLRRRTVMLHIGGSLGPRLIIAWDHKYLGEAEQVLIEFKDFGDDEAFSPELRFSRATENDWVRFWPFAYNAAIDCQGDHQHCFRCLRCKHKYEVMRLRLKRFSISRKRISSTTYSTEGNIPGSWVE
ncbi:hypothetical protein F5Y19DRAFT_491082 [Xylariaceae sp. FL1651]|nr:hypothetical protein F5Y19DRAFT_491082 [Xylariaceae sp. FL1651]